jgi:hypothetical protein
MTPFPDTRPSVDRAEVTAVTSLLHWPAWQEDSAACAAPTAVPLDRVRLTAAKSGLGRHRKLHLARPQGSDSASAPEDDELRLARPEGSDSASATEDDKLRLARPQGSDSALASADGLRLARPKGSDSTSTSEDRLDLDLGGASASPYLGLGQPRHRRGHHYPTPS